MRALSYIKISCLFVLFSLLSGHRADGALTKEKTAGKHAFSLNKNHGLALEKANDTTPLLKRKHRCKGVEVSLIVISQQAIKLYAVNRAQFIPLSHCAYCLRCPGPVLLRGPPQFIA